MKTFLNVLYRKILYKIPLKFLLLLLAIFGLFFASCNAYDIGFGNTNHGFYANVGQNNYSYNIPGNSALVLYSSTWISMEFVYSGIVNSGYPNGYFNSVILNNSDETETVSFSINNNGSTRRYIYVQDYIYFTEPLSCPTCTPQYTSEECQTEYGLVESGALISCETDLNSCISNTSGFNDLLNNCSNNLNACNLSLSSCLSNNCPTTSGDISWSSLFINDIQHIGGPSIYIGIPEEIERDYSYVDDDMYINVDGYNVDYEKIEGIIDVQNYKPSQEDFNNIIGILADYMPIIVIFLGLLFIYKMIRKPFKSKL